MNYVDLNKHNMTFINTVYACPVKNIVKGIKDCVSNDQGKCSKKIASSMMMMMTRKYHYASCMVLF